jgi:chemotaxis signal transduction protein
MAAEALVVTIGDLRCALPMHRLVEVRVHEPVTRVPGSPEWVCGIVDRNGVPVEVFDAARRLGIPSRAERPCLIFFEHAAMLVADVHRLIECHSADVACDDDVAWREMVQEMIDDEGVPLPLLDIDSFFKERA